MNFLAWVTLFGWIPLSAFLFMHRKPHHAVLISVIGGWLLLPQTSTDLPGLPAFTKSTAIALGLLIGGILSKNKAECSFRIGVYDLPMIVYCVTPIFSSISNHLGFYDGIASVYSEILVWGIPYLAGRIYLHKAETLNDLVHALIFGGLLYAPLCLYEIRMSPQLSNMVYGFFPHSFLQHFRYGGFRPIVFLQHGLAVSLWMAVTSVLAFWLWRNKGLSKMLGLPMWLVVAFMLITCILCKSANGWIFMTIGCAAYFYYRRTQSCRPFALAVLLIPGYIILRITGLLPSNEIEQVAASIFDYERAESLGIRLYQEELFGLKALQRPIFGWGGYGRGWPVDPLTGELMVQMIDSLWLITFSTRGFAGLTSFFGFLLLGPWLVFREKRGESARETQIKVVVLSLVVLFFALDTLVNAMPNPIFVLISGSLIGWIINQRSMIAKREKKKNKENNARQRHSCQLQNRFIGY